MPTIWGLKRLPSLSTRQLVTESRVACDVPGTELSGSFLDPQKKRGAVRPELRIFRNVSPRDGLIHACLSEALTEGIRHSNLWPSLTEE